MAKKLVKNLNSKFERLKQTWIERGWERIGKDIKDYIVPDRGRYLRGESDRETDYARKEDRQYVIDDTGEQAAGFLVSAFMSMLVPQNTKWLKFNHPDPEMNKNKRVRVWLDDVVDLILRVFDISDAYGTMYNTFMEFCTFSTGCQLIDEDPINSIRPKSYTFGEYFFQIGKGGKLPDTFGHRSYWSAEELKAEFGEENLSKQVLEELRGAANSQKRYLIRHLIEPNDGRTPGLRNPQGMPFNSVYWEAATSETSEKLLRISGYEEFPVQTPRWISISNDTYGKESPGWKQLPNIKMLQNIVEDRLTLTKRIGDPPMVSNGDQNEINSLPGGISYTTNLGGQSAGVTPLFNENPQSISVLIESENRTRELIEQGFYKPIFLIVSDTSDAKRMTATEATIRDSERLAVLSPVLNRVFTEMLKPMVDRTFNILTGQGFFGPEGEYPVPPELEGEELEIEFVSVMAQAQKAVGQNDVDRYLERIMGAAQVFPEILDGVNPDALHDEYARTIPARIQRDQEERDELRARRQAQQEAAAEMAAIESASESMERMGNTPTSDGTVLAELGAEEEA